MNIGIIYGYHKYPPKSGGDVHFYQLVKNLVEIGHIVKVFPWNAHPQARIVPYSKVNLLRFLYSIDVLYIRVTWDYLDKYILLKLLRPSLPLVLEVNAPFEESYHFKGGKVLYSKEEFFKRFRFLVNGVIVVSNKLKEYVISELGIENVCVIPNGSDPNMFSRAIKDTLFDGDYVNIFWMGSSKYPWQGIRIIEKTISAIPDTLAEFNVRFTLVCDKRYLSEFIVGNDFVDIVDEVSYLEIPKYLRNADICLCLYDVAYYSKMRFGFYGSPLKLFDYMAAAKPIIATRIGQISEVLEDMVDGMLIDNNDLDSTIRFLVEHQDESVSMGKRAREKIISMYNWRNIAHMTAKFIESFV